MTDSNADLLIAILSIGITIVLICTIVVLYYMIKILKSLRSITEKANHIAGNVDSVSEFFSKTAGPVAIGKLIANIVETMRHKEEKKK